MHFRLFIIVPAFTPDGPVKGAIALANSIAKAFETHIVSLKGGAGANSAIHPGIHVHDFGSVRSWAAKRQRLIALMPDGRARNAVISYCFSADAFSLSLRRRAILIASIRANNFVNYRESYGLTGLALAYLHYALLRAFDGVYVFDSIMAKQVARFSSKPPVIIGNFIDELCAERYRGEFLDTNGEPVRLVFLGSLTRRKQPLLLASAVRALVAEGLNITCTYVGEGMQRGELEQFVRDNRLADRINLTGFRQDPLRVLTEADLLVLPSISEGAPRAALEALFLGVPCVLRQVDGNAALISPGVNGELFRTDDELQDAIRRAVCLSLQLRKAGGRKQVLLAEQNRQSVASSMISRDIHTRLGTRAN